MSTTNDKILMQCDNQTETPIELVDLVIRDADRPDIRVEMAIVTVDGDELIFTGTLSLQQHRV